MAYINILDPREYDIKVISIDSLCIKEDTHQLLEENESYVDQVEGLDEHLYSPHDILENVGKTMLDTEQLELIKESCDEAGAAYFRIVKV